MNPPNSDTPTDCNECGSPVGHNASCSHSIRARNEEIEQLRARLAEVERERDLLKSSDLGFTSTVSPSVEILRPDSVRDFNQAASALSGEAEISDLKTHLAEAQKERDAVKEALEISTLAVDMTVPWEKAMLADHAQLRAKLTAAESLNAKLAERLGKYVRNHRKSYDEGDNFSNRECREIEDEEALLAEVALYREGKNP